MLLIGCDFSSRPMHHKPVVMAVGESVNHGVHLQEILCFSTLDAWSEWLCRTPAWLGGFDFPFGLPRELVQTLGWPLQWEPCMRHYVALERSQIRDLFAEFCGQRPPGGKFAHRATDRPAGSSPSMKWVNPPVAYMMHAGIPVLLRSGACLPGLHGSVSSATNPDMNSSGVARVALEAYPGLLAREILGARSYKSDDKRKQDASRLLARKDVLTALEQGRTRLGLRLRVRPALAEAMVSDAKGDALDAVLCLMQAAWAQEQGPPWYGLPPTMDPLEGWIVSA